MDVADLTDRALAHQPHELVGLRMEAPHERLHQHAVGRVGGVEGLLDQPRVTRQRLLAQHVLAGLAAP